MGDMVSDSATRDVIAQINWRFEAGDSIAEVAALHQKFKVFSKDHSLYDMWLLLGIKASDPPERALAEVDRGIPDEARFGHERRQRSRQAGEGLPGESRVEDAVADVLQASLAQG